MLLTHTILISQSLIRKQTMLHITLLNQSVLINFNYTNLTYSTTKPINSSLHIDVQPTSHTSKRRMFPSSRYTEEKLKFIFKSNFKFPDVTYTECITLCNLLLKQKTYYDTKIRCS